MGNEKDKALLTYDRKAYGKKPSTRKPRVTAALRQQRTLFVRFPFHENLREFEAEPFDCIMKAKTFIEEAEVQAAAIVNGVGSKVATYVLGEWLSYS